MTWRGRLRGLRAGLFSAAAQGLAVAALFTWTYEGRFLEAPAFDLATALAPRVAGTPASDIVLVTIGREDLVKYGTPDGGQLKRAALARLIDSLASLKRPPSSIALDLFFARESGPEDAVLAEAMQRAGNVLIASPMMEGEKSVSIEALTREKPGSPLVIWRAAARMAWAEARADSDGVLRRLAPVDMSSGKLEPHYALLLALRQLRATSEPERRGRTLECRLPRPPNLELPLAYDGTMLLMLREAGEQGELFPRVPVSELIEGRDRDRLERLVAEKIVLVGVVDPASPDRHVLPFRRFDITAERSPGVEVLAQVTDNLLQRRLLRPLSEGLFYAVSAGVGAAAAHLASMLSLGGALIMLGMVWTTSLFLGFSVFNAGLFVNYMDLGVVATLSVAWIILGRYVRYGRGQTYLTRTLSQYVGQAMSEELASSLALVRAKGERRCLTVLFSDIRGFTTLSESMEPANLFELLNEYLSEMTEVVSKHRGHLDKFIGDAVMAFWGARPVLELHAEAACEAALDMGRALSKLRESWAARKLPSLEIGVGINTGEAVVGNMGSQKRLNYTVLGDTVNLGSRLEGLTKVYGVGIILGEETARLVEAAFIVRRLDRVRVKGRATPTAIFELMSRRGELSDRQLDCRMHFEVGLDAYFRQEWEEALGAFGNALKANPADGPTLLFVDRTIAFRSQPPDESWDGVFTLKTK